MNRILRIFWDINMNCQHDGLTKIAKKEKVILSDLGIGEFVCFLNRKKDRLKIFTADNILVYARAPKGQIDLGTIKRIPYYFRSGKFQYDEALQAELEVRLKKDAA